MSYVTMGTWGMNSALCELQLRPGEKVILGATTPLKSIKPLNQLGLVQMAEVTVHSASGLKFNE